MNPTTLKNPPQQPKISPASDSNDITKQSSKDVRSARVNQDQRLNELCEKVQSLQKTIEFKSHYLDYCSHELKTPLMVIFGSVNLLLDDMTEPLTETQRGLATKIKTVSLRMSELIENILNVSRIDAHQFTLNKIPYSIPKVIHEVIHFFQEPFGKQGIQIVFSPLDTVDDPQYVCEIDHDLFSHAISNIFSNVLQHSRCKMTTIFIYANTASAPRHNVQLIIQDDGVGIPKDKLPKIFDRFATFKTDPSSATKGTGLGLYIAKEIITLHKGTIKAENDLAGGAKFIITLPQ